jgi:hypothetical protein
MWQLQKTEGEINREFNYAVGTGITNQLALKIETGL